MQGIVNRVGGQGEVITRDSPRAAYFPKLKTMIDMEKILLEHFPDLAERSKEYGGPEPAAGPASSCPFADAAGASGGDASLEEKSGAAPF